MKQVWFPGCHTSVGGGDQDHGISDISLAWMVQQIRNNTKLEVDTHYLHHSRKDYAWNHMDTQWGCADFEDSFKGVFRFSGKAPRQPGKPMPKLGGRTNEYVHICVRERLQKLGKYERITPHIFCLDYDDFGKVERELQW